MLLCYLLFRFLNTAAGFFWSNMARRFRLAMRPAKAKPPRTPDTPSPSVVPDISKFYGQIQPRRPISDNDSMTTVYPRPSLDIIRQAHEEAANRAATEWNRRGGVVLRISVHLAYGTSFFHTSMRTIFLSCAIHSEVYDKIFLIYCFIFSSYIIFIYFYLLFYFYLFICTYFFSFFIILVINNPKG